MHASLSQGSSGTMLFLYAALLLSLWAPWCRGLDISYCSPFNNAGNYPGYYNFYQSNGACQVHCQGAYAFAVLQGYTCWCSNYIPTPQQSTGNCNQGCPGISSEWCGSTDNGLYAYFILNSGVPLGTSGTGPSSPSATSFPSSTSPVSIVASTPVSTSPSATGSTTSSHFPAPWPTYSSSSSSSSVVTPGPSQSSPSQSSSQASIVISSSESWTTSTATSTTTSSSSSSPSPTPIPTEIYTSITTVTGGVRTIIVTPTPATSSDASLGQSSTGGGVSTGKVVGIVMGVALGIGALIGIGVYIWFRRRHIRRQDEAGPETTFVPRTGDTSPSNNAPSRHASQLSSTTLLASKIPRINTSSGFLSNTQRPADVLNSAASDRRSVATDQRLNPYALYMSEQGRVSNVSLQDNHDYSRQLRVANPDD